jgi:phosphate transport system protein
MSRIMNSGLEELSTTLYRMGELTHRTVLNTLVECHNGKEAYKEIREMSDTLTAMADRVEDKAFELIARFQPVASDLRTIKSYMKISYDFARIGRYALDISFTNKRLGGLRNCEQWIISYVKDIGEKALDMVRLSVELLKSYDLQLVEKISIKENEVDSMYFEFLGKLIRSSATIKCAVSSILIVRYLERIADHATYICESIIYIATGKSSSKIIYHD